MGDNNQHQAQIEDLAKKVQKHENMLVGDQGSYPPRAGVMTVLQNMVDKLTDKNTGLDAVNKRTTDIEQADIRRLAFFNGAKWLTVTFWTVFGALAGFAIAAVTMLKTH